MKVKHWLHAGLQVALLMLLDLVCYTVLNFRVNAHLHQMKFSNPTNRNIYLSLKCEERRGEERRGEEREERRGEEGRGGGRGGEGGGGGGGGVGGGGEGRERE